MANRSGFIGILWSVFSICQILPEGSLQASLQQQLIEGVVFDLEVEKPKVLALVSQFFPGRVLKAEEIGDGNVNFIWRVSSDRGEQWIVKQALPFARCNPEAFPLPKKRLFYEFRAFSLYQKCCPGLIPQIHCYDAEQAMLVMEYLTPHQVLRDGLNQGKSYPHLGEHLGTFLAQALYSTSQYCLEPEEFQANVDLFAKNTAMRQIILDLNFTQPFYGSELNRVSKGCEDLAQRIQEDSKIKEVVEALKKRFLECPEALAHGDFHMGSMLATQEDTRVFDAEFAICAPIAFDIGMLFGNFFMAAVTAKAHGGDRAWLAQVTKETWDVFAEKFPRKDLLEGIWKETQQLMGVEMIRRTMGMARVSDYATIQDEAVRVACEREVLERAIRLILDPSLKDSEALKHFINHGE